MSEDSFENFKGALEDLSSVAGWFKGIVIGLVILSFAAGAWATRVLVRVEDLIEVTKELQVAQATRDTETNTYRREQTAVISRHEQTLIQHEQRINKLEDKK